MPGSSRTAIVRRLRETARLLELAGESPFRARAYENAARTLEGLPTSPEELLESGRLAELPGIGPGLAAAVAELVSSGRLALAEELEQRIPRGLLELFQLSGLGAKRIRALAEALGIRDLVDLESACRAGAVAGLPGFSSRLQSDILAAIGQRQRYRERHLLSEASERAERIEERLAQIPGLTRWERAGSLRRSLETIGDLDYVLTPDSGLSTEDLLALLAAQLSVGWELNTQVPIRGSLEGNWNLDLFLAVPENFGWVWVQATGPSELVEDLSRRAHKRGFEVESTGWTRSGSRVELPDEETVYELLDLPWLPPDLRDTVDAWEGSLGGSDSLITLRDLQGTFHVHTSWSDGRASLEEMADSARLRGWSYLGIADHSQSAGYASGLSPERVWAQWKTIEEWNQDHPDLYLFRGTECDILPDGRLDFEDDLLLGFDFVVASVHSRLQLDPEAMTRRLIRAVEHPAVTILGHPSGRLLLQREPYSADLSAVLAAARRSGVIVELNASPYRLDLDWRLLRDHLAAGGLTAINPDAHSLRGLDDVRFGVSMARKAGARPEQVVNTWPRTRVAHYLANRRAQARQMLGSN